ncbi:MAG: glycosyltransferase family 87 protein [Pseudomonadota bacterium]
MTKALKWIDDQLTEDRAKVMALAGGCAFLFIMGLALWQMIFVTWGNKYTFGFDFTSFWAAAKLAVAGNAEWAFDGQRFESLQDLASKVAGVLYWHYPPTWVALLYPFGWLSPPTALIVYTVLSAGLWVWIVRSMIAGSWLDRVAVLLSPAFYLCIIGGQNGVLVAGALTLFITGVIHKRDWMIVVACTLLLAKPHFGVLMPVVLIALGRWRAFGWSAIFGSLFVAFSIWLTGWEYLTAFLANTETVGSAIKGEQLLRLQYSAYAFFRSIGVPQTLSLMIQIPVALAAIVACWIAFRRNTVSDDLRIAVFLIGSLMISPYAFQYDMPAFVIGMWFLHRASKSAPIPGQNLAIALVWIFPAINRRLHTETDISWFFVPVACLCAITLIHLYRQAFTKPA